MINFITIQKLADDMGLHTSYIRTMIKNKDLIAYKKDGYKRIYISLDEFNSTIRPVHQQDSKIDLDNFLV